jgi:hypothetical protein
VLRLQLRSWPTTQVSRSADGNRSGVRGHSADAACAALAENGCPRFGITHSEEGAINTLWWHYKLSRTGHGNEAKRD